MMADLYLAVGLPGIGKSTWLKAHIKPKIEYVSRDDIRFSLLKLGENYFAHESEAFRIFTANIRKGLLAGKDVFADATHINHFSRNKLTRNISPNLYDHIYVFYFKGDVQTSIFRNSKRWGTRRYVDENLIQKMSINFEEPTLAEGFDKIFVIAKNGVIENIISKNKN